MTRTEKDILAQINAAWREMLFLSARLENYRLDKAKEVKGACRILESWKTEIEKGVE